MRKANKGYRKEDSLSSQKTKNLNEIVYANPAKPLDFSFKEVRYMDDLRKMEPRNGTRRPISEIEKEEAEKNDNNKYEKTTYMNYEDEIITEKVVERKGRVDSEIHLDKKENKNKFDDGEDSASGPKKKVKYLNYNNSVILHSNKIKSLQNVHSVFNEILPEVGFLVNKSQSKIDLIQWIDISHNQLVDIHPDILNLPFLKILYCHANCIEEISSVTVLSQCKSLLNLTLHGNPIEHIKGYRNYIIELVPSLEKLDYTLVSDKELDIIKYRGSRFGEKRDKTGRILSYPKIDEEILKRMKKPKEEDQEKKDDN